MCWPNHGLPPARYALLAGHLTAFTDNGDERLFCVVETKGGLFMDDLRGTEGAKIECGKAHFEALAACEAPAEYVVARTVDDIMARC